jgi:hypothetical protein
MSSHSPGRLTLLLVAAAGAGFVWWTGRVLAPDAMWHPLPSVGLPTSPPIGTGMFTTVTDLAPNWMWLLRCAAVCLSFYVAWAVGRSRLAATAIALTLASGLTLGGLSHATVQPLGSLVGFLALVGTVLWREQGAQRQAMRLGLAAVGLVWIGWLLTADSDVVLWAPQRIVVLVRMVAAELGFLGGTLLLLGMAHLRHRPTTATLLVGWAAVGLLWGVFTDAPDWSVAVVFAAVPLWLIAAAGVGWLRTVASTGRARWATAGLVLCLPAVSLVADVQEGARVNGVRRFVDRYAEHLGDLVPNGAVVVREGGLVERLLVSRQWPEAAVGGRWIAQEPRQVESALAAGTPVVAFAGARRHLRELGFHFQTVADAGVPMTVPELLATVPAGWIVAVAATPQFALTVRPEFSETFARVGGREPLFGQAGKGYVLIGASGRAPALHEQQGTGPLALQLKAGASVTRRIRLPAGLAVRSQAGRAEVEYRGETVAVSETGIALAVISPSGQLEATFAPEFSGDLTVRANPPSLRVGLVTGREPCQPVDTAWTNLGASVRSASLGGLLDAGRSAVVYLGAAQPLVPRQAQLNHDAVPRVTVLAFDREQREDLVSREAWFRHDAVDHDAAKTLGESAYVYRVEVEPLQEGTSQLALRLGGFPGAAFARAADAMTFCAAMRPEADLLDVNLERSDLFLYGWNDVERTSQGPFRWTRASVAQMVLPGRQSGPRVVAITARPLMDADADLTLSVNGRPLGGPLRAEPVRGATREYLWDVPASIWRAGMNRLQIGVSRLGRPSDIGQGTDDRLLGVAVEGISVRRNP